MSQTLIYLGIGAGAFFLYYRYKMQQTLMRAFNNLDEVPFHEINRNMNKITVKSGKFHSGINWKGIESGLHK